MTDNNYNAASSAQQAAGALKSSLTVRSGVEVSKRNESLRKWREVQQKITCATTKNLPEP